MPAALIAAAAWFALVALSVAADRRWRHVPSLPMHWSLAGRVTWSAPRRVALAFTPLLAAALFAAMLALPSPSPSTATAMIAPLTLILIVVHMLHLWLIARSLRR